MTERSCRRCQRIRPDHAEDCPVRILAQQLADMSNAPRGTVTPIHIEISEDQ